MAIVLGIFMFGLLIFVHELGHFLVARLCGIRVHAFAIGMGPAIFKKEKNGVEYSIRILPIGGFVKLEGEDEASDDPAAFGNKSPIKRIGVLFAGGFMNILAGLIIFVIVFSSVPGIRVPVVGDVVANTPAATCGMEKGDIITKINGSKIHIQNDVTLALMKNGAKPLEVEILRNGETLSKTITPAPDAETGSYILGFYPTVMKMTPSLAIKTAYHNTSFVVELVYFSLGEMITGKVQLRDMAGPVGIVQEMNAVAKKELPYLNMLNFMGLIAVNLGVMNLLPFPALDGGRIFFALAELITRKRISPEKEGLVHLVGFGLLIALMLVITFSDITKLFA